MTRVATGTRRIKGLANRYVNRLIALSFVLRECSACCVTTQMVYSSCRFNGNRTVNRAKRRPRPITEWQQHARTHAHTRTHLSRLTLCERRVRPLQVPLGLMTQLVLRYDKRRSMRGVFFTRRNRESMRWIKCSLVKLEKHPRLFIQEQSTTRNSVCSVIPLT